jgi:hypothetical protein
VRRHRETRQDWVRRTSGVRQVFRLCSINRRSRDPVASEWLGYYVRCHGFALALLLAACGKSEHVRVANIVRPPEVKGIASVRPVDEMPRDSALAALRDTLRSIVARRDTAALARHFSPDIKFSLGDSDGRAGFFEYWIKYESLDRMWSELADILEHGGRFSSPDDFSAPWTFTALPDSLDAFEHLIIRDSAVIVRARADTAAAPIATLSWTVVRAGGNLADTVWRSIRLPNDSVGYVEARHVRSSVEYRIGFTRKGGRWVIDYFIAGD